MSRTFFSAGGELPISIFDIFSKRNGQFSDYTCSLAGYHRYYTFGAYYSLKVIIANVKCTKDEYFLLPSYLCPSILLPFKECFVRYKFYNVDENLRPEIEEIVGHIGKGMKAVLFIDYFGYPQKKHLLQLVEMLQIRSVEVIQDTVQSWINNQKQLYGDFCFNSFRKYTPYEGSVILSKKPLKFKQGFKKLSRFLVHKRYAQILRFYHQKYGWFKPDTFLHHIEESNKSYHQKGIAGLPKLNRFMLDKFDFYSTGEERKEIYKALLDMGLFTPLIICSDPDVIPLGLAIKTENRDEVKFELMKRNIFCPIHWLLSPEIEYEKYKTSWIIQKHELTLPTNVSSSRLNEYKVRLREVFN